MIQLQNVTFSYDEVPALQDVSLVETEPVIMGLWGRNGAGKTTLMNLLAGHEQPAPGNIAINGNAPYNNAEIAHNICYMQEEQPFSLSWTVADALRFGRYFNEDWEQESAEHLLNTFGLNEEKKVQKLSKGMKSALQFIIGLASNASVTILDEPINGLDAGMRMKMYEVLRKSYDQNPRLIVISTHHIEEVQPIFESLMVLHRGEKVFYKPIEDVRERGVWIAGAQNKVKNEIRGQKVLERNEVGNMLKVMIDAPWSTEWKKHADAKGFSIEKAKLQDYLLNITKRDEVLL